MKRHLAKRTSERLRDLANEAGSVSELCRLAGINRQQFAKYLTGNHVPSLIIIEKVCQAVGIDMGEFFIDEETRTNARYSGIFDIAGRSGFEDYLGYYLEISQSDVEPGYNLISICRIWQDNDMIRYRRKMRVQQLGRSDIWNYDGFCLKTRNAFSIIYTNTTNSANIGHYNLTKFPLHIDDCVGIKAGISSKLGTLPFSSTVYFMYFEAKQLRNNFRKIGLHKRDKINDPKIKEAIELLNAYSRNNELISIENI